MGTVRVLRRLCMRLAIVESEAKDSPNGFCQDHHPSLSSWVRIGLTVPYSISIIDDN